MSGGDFSKLDVKGDVIYLDPNVAHEHNYDVPVYDGNKVYMNAECWCRDVKPSVKKQLTEAK